MKKISRILCLLIIISIVISTFSFVHADWDVPELDLTITGLKEPTIGAKPNFSYNLNVYSETSANVEELLFHHWFEIDEDYEDALNYLNSLEDTYPDDFLDICSKMKFNKRLQDYSYFADWPFEEFETFLPGKTYAAVLCGAYNNGLLLGDPNSDPSQSINNPGFVPLGTPNFTAPSNEYADITTSVNGKTSNVRTFAYYNFFTIIALFEAPNAPVQCKATINWINTKESNIPNSIDLKLLGNDKIIQEKTITKENAVDPDTWEYDFGDQPEYDKNGEKITYTLEYSETNKDDLKFFQSSQNGFVLDNTFIEPELSSKVKMTSIVDREANNVKYKITFDSSIQNYSGDADVVLTTTLPFAIDKNKSNLDGGTYDSKTRSIVWTETIKNIKKDQDYTMEKNIDIYPTAVLPYAIEAKTIGEIRLTAVNDYSESVDTVDNIESTTGNPKTGDENLQKYLSIGLIGLATILIVINIKRKYSTKKSKVQF